MNQDRSFRRLSIYFGLFATIAASMIGLGQDSWNLPMLVCIACIVSAIYTDRYGWFSLHRWLVYIGMIAGAGVAIFEFLGNGGTQPLQSVGNLLVYVQLPLMFQKKSKRVFEQWGVFLLLELVVAALVNDNVLYGVMMLPVLGIGCAALMALAQFASHLRHNESFSESTSYFARMIHWIGKEQFVTKRNSGITLTASKPSWSERETKSVTFAPSRWISSILPTAASVFVFSVAYFFILPRLNSGAYEGFGGGYGSIGFSEQISLGQIGQLLQNETPAFRMELRNAKTGEFYLLNQPPYIRATVVHTYIPGKESGSWQMADGGAALSNRMVHEIPATTDFNETLAETADPVEVSVTERISFNGLVPSIAPFAQSRMVNRDFKMVRRDWRMLEINDNTSRGFGSNRKRRYSYTSYCFTRGQESAFLPDLDDCLSTADAPSTATASSRQYSQGELTEFPASLEMLIPYRDQVIASNPNFASDKLSRALLFEEHFAVRGDFNYSLHLTGPIDDSVDPVVDFILNKKEGHCQYFATALALMLRSMKIPSRLVVGFRPSEYNEIGNYFLVQQKHAHVWVEAYFTRNELEARSIPIPSWVTKGAWLRLDPTPTGEGSNAGGTFRSSNGQTLDVMQDLWTEMVMNMDKSRQSSILSLFGESSGGSYRNYWLQIYAAINRMQSSRFIGGFLSPDRWFSFQFAAGFFVVACTVVILYRGLLWLFPNAMPRIRWRNQAKKSKVSTIEFYNRLVRILGRFGLKRKAYETQKEFLGSAAIILKPAGVDVDSELLANAFYEQRFGGTESLAPQLQSEIDSSVQQLESLSSSSVRSKIASQT